MKEKYCLLFTLPSFEWATKQTWVLDKRLSVKVCLSDVNTTWCWKFGSKKSLCQAIQNFPRWSELQIITEMSLTQQNFYVYLHFSVQQNSFLKQVGIWYD